MGLRKSTIEKIKKRFDNDVERFSSLDIGQTTTVDTVLAIDLVTQAAAFTTPHASHVLDVERGAGNFTLKLLQRLPNIDVTRVDLSRPMLDRARFFPLFFSIGGLASMVGQIFRQWIGSRSGAR